MVPAHRKKLACVSAVAMHSVLPRWVNNGPEGPETPLPVFPYEPTSSGRADWSVSCQKLTSQLSEKRAPAR